MDKCKYILSALALALTLSAAAQSKEEARKMFLAGKYAEAKPIFEKLLKRSPNDASLNYWYAACCYETGDTGVKIEPMLTLAAKRRVINANRYLGCHYYDTYRYEEAAEAFGTYLKESKESDSIKEFCRRRAESAATMQRMIKVTKRVTVIDSTVVDKGTFLSAYKIGREAGSLSDAGRYFGNPTLSGRSTVYENEMKDQLYWAQPTPEAGMKIFTSQKTAGEWGAARQPGGLEALQGDQNYPYMLSDGITLYFASNGEGSVGGYDLFVTRYNSDAERYLLPENMGLPFSSPANDYLLAIDELNNIGWFASDRFQPAGKVCVYTFVPQSSYSIYDFENTDYQELTQAALLTSIAATQSDADEVAAARERLLTATYQNSDSQQSHGDFLFVIDDRTDYHTLSDFKNQQAMLQYRQWLQKQKKMKADLLQLEKLRDTFGTLKESERAQATATMLALERQTEQAAAELEEEEIEIRNTEIKTINK